MGKVRHIERLDARRLLAATLNDSVLTVTGTDRNDDILLSVHANFINLLSVSVNGIMDAFLLGDYTTIQVNALGGKDTVRVGELFGGHPATLIVDGGAGNDILYGSSQSETLLGGSGNDCLVGGDGDDRLDGGKYGDVLKGGGGNDMLLGREGNDTLDGERGNDRLLGDAGSDALADGFGINTLFGGDGDDRLDFQTGKKTNRDRGGGYGYGGAGNDTVVADYVSDGRDFDYLTTPSGGYQPDPVITAIVYGDAGDDKLVGSVAYGGTGNDEIIAYYKGFGDAGNDTLEAAGYWPEMLDGAAGNDVLTLHAGMYAHGGDGNDAITVLDQHAGGGSRFPIDGGSGDDFIRGSLWAESLVGGTGNDTLMGAGGDDSLVGNDGVDYLYGGSGNDTLDAGAGDDFLYAGDRNDKDRSDNGADIALGGLGKDWFEPKQNWVKTDYEKEDKSVNSGKPSGAIVSNGSASSGSMSLNVGYSDLLPIVQPYNGVSETADTTPFKSLIGSSAIFGGMMASSGIPEATIRNATPPELTATERKGLRPSVVHVESHWQLSPAGSIGDVKWFRVQTTARSYASLFGLDTKIYRLIDGRYETNGRVESSGFHSIFFIGVHKGSVLVYARDSSSLLEPAYKQNASFNLGVLVTRPGTRAMVAATGQMLTFGKPTSLPAMASGSKGLALVDGVLYLEPNGARFEWR